MVKFKRKKKIAIQVSNKFRDYYKSELFCDFSLFVGKETIKCHKIVLAAISPWFEDWFKRDENVSSLKVYNFTFEQIKALMDLLYTGHFYLKKKTDLHSLYSKAKLFQIEITDDMIEVVGEDRPSSADLMPPPPRPQPSASQAVRSNRFEDMLGNGENDSDNERNSSMEMDDYLPFSQVVTQRPPRPLTPRPVNRQDDDDDDGDDRVGDEHLPFSQVIGPTASENNNLPKTPSKFKCNVPGCKHSFPKERDMLNHKRKYHEKKNFKCPVAACKKKFERGKMFGEHMKEKHPDYVRERYEAKQRKHRDSDSNDTIITGSPEELEVKIEFEDSDNSQNIFK